jgi:hypothetical protein
MREGSDDQVGRLDHLVRQAIDDEATATCELGRRIAA